MLERQVIESEQIRARAIRKRRQQTTATCIKAWLGDSQAPNRLLVSANSEHTGDILLSGLLAMLRLAGRPYTKEEYCERNDDSKSGCHSPDTSQRSFRDSGSG